MFLLSPQHPEQHLKVQERYLPQNQELSAAAFWEAVKGQQDFMNVLDNCFEEMKRKNCLMEWKRVRKAHQMSPLRDGRSGKNGSPNLATSLFGSGPQNCSKPRISTSFSHGNNSLTSSTFTTSMTSRFQHSLRSASQGDHAVRGQLNILIPPG